MKKAKHTPGTWSIQEHTEIRGVDGFVAETCFKHIYGKGNCCIPTAKEKANAHLIAAAPELLEACKDVYNHYTRLYRERIEKGDVPAHMQRLQMAIAKAEGTL